MSPTSRKRPGSSVKDTPSKKTKIMEVSELLSGCTAKLIVGTERKDWLIHENMLCAKPDFFAAALKGAFKERDGVIELPEEEPAAFEITPLPTIDSDDELRTYLGVYVMAEKLLIPSLKKEAFNSIYKYHVQPGLTIINKEVKPKAENIHYNFDNTMEYSVDAELYHIAGYHNIM
ncbi:hypothetical protein B0T16DRAFT_394988 [Cercophora newfieldiana]|uniref:BTB domain-containing protein n=1 Tax=Cercophora newfieldiana TaxID=92897 RepID=A0AA39XS45_9PEZI|nr:hypothetical protein B0T16DRAFT_394988 [Cercophora newfieldiana]